MKSKKASALPKLLLVLWAVGSLIWVVWAWGVTDASRTVGNYRTVLRYENMIQSGGHNQITRDSYLRAAKRANDSSKYIGKFILLGLGVPFLALVAGYKIVNRKK